MGTDTRHTSQDEARLLAKSRRRERGASIVEAAFVTPLFFLLIFGIFEFGFLFRNYLTIGNAGREGARAASVAGSAPDADFVVLRTIDHAFDAWGVENLDFVVVYHAQGPDSTLPAACKLGPVGGSGSLPGLCNYFTPAEFLLALDDANGDPTPYFRCQATSVDRHWCPTDRDSALGAVSPDPLFEDGPAYIGVYLQAEHRYITGLFGSSKTLSIDNVIRIEPDRP